jgi:alpha-galactosidase
MVADIMTNPALAGSTISLVDIDSEAVRLMKAVAKRMKTEWGSDIKVEGTVDRKRALPEAEFVLVAVEAERLKRWAMDWQIPIEHGLRQPLGENGGPAGLAHCARTIGIVMGICDDMRRLCPDAWFFNFTNPVPRVALAAWKYGGVKAAGFCHQLHWAGFGNVGRLLGVPREDLDIKAAGLNHFTWMLDIRRKSTAEDLYPALRRKLRSWPDDFEPLTRDVFEVTGVFPAPGDSHMAEYLPWVCDPQSKPWERYDLTPPDFVHSKKQLDRGRRREAKTLFRKLASGATPLDHYGGGSGEGAVPAIPNEGYISNLPHQAMVEVPAMVSSFGIRGVSVGDIPGPAAELCRRQVAVMELAVKAAATGDRTAALQALAMDPMVTDLQMAKGMLQDYLRLHGDLLPQFKRARRPLGSCGRPPARGSMPSAPLTAAGRRGSPP